MKTKWNIFVLWMMIVSCMLFTIACSDDDELGEPDRLFRPIVNGTTVAGTWLTISWDKYQGTNAYHIELSEYEDFSQILVDEVIEVDEYTFEGLQYNTSYYVRLTALGNGIESRPITYKATTTKFPTKLLSPSISDCIDTQVRMKWDEIEYDSMRVFIGKKYIKTVEVSAENNASKELIVKELLPDTVYTIKAYTDNDYLGEMDYTTVPDQVFDGAFDDLRGLDAGEARTKLTQAYFDELADLYPEGVTVVLEGGANYDVGTVNISVKTRIVTGLSLQGRAVIHHNGGIGVAAGSTFQSLTLENLIVTDHNDAPASSGNFGGKYLLDIRGTTESTAVEEINIINCDVRYKRGFLRAQSAIQIQKFTIDNCVIDSIGGYGVVNADNTKAYLDNVVIRNTTIAHAEKVLVCAKPDRSPNSLLMENLTICYAPKGSGYIIDWNGKEVSGGIIIKNCIFGTGWSDTVNGMRSASNSVLVDNCFSTSDLNWVMNATTNEPNNPIKDLELLNLTTDQVFENAQEINFGFKDAASQLNGKVGDPRWWK